MLDKSLLIRGLGFVTGLGLELPPCRIPLSVDEEDNTALLSYRCTSPHLPQSRVCWNSVGMQVAERQRINRFKGLAQLGWDKDKGFNFPRDSPRLPTFVIMRLKEREREREREKETIQLLGRRACVPRIYNALSLSLSLCTALSLRLLSSQTRPLITARCLIM